MFNAKILTGSQLLGFADGVPQGNPLSPLLSNIYFNKLDEKMELIIRKYNKGEKATRNLAYVNATLVTVAEKEGRSDTVIRMIRKRKIREARRKGILPTTTDENYCRINYVRYADDFIVGIRGERTIAVQIKKEIKDFLKSDLHLEVSEEKTKITNVYYGKASFLGMKIFGVPASKIPNRRAAHVERFRRLKRRITLRLEAAENKRIKAITHHTLKKLKNKEIDSKERNETIKRISKLPLIDGAIKETNNKGILRNLAEELSNIDSNGEDKELGKILNKLKVWVKENPVELKKEEKAKEIPKIPITMKEIATRLHKKFKDSLNLGDLPKKGFFLTTDDKMILNESITKLPEQFDLSPKQIESINKKFKKKREAHYRMVEILRILMKKQKDYEDITLIDNPRAIGIRKTLESVGSNISLPHQIYADMDKLKNKLQGLGIINEKGGYGVAYRIINGEDYDIIKYYNSLAHGLLSYYRCADNLNKIKSYVAYYLKFSLISTLRVKHKLNKGEVIKRYGSDITCVNHKQNKVSFLSNSQIYGLKQEFLANARPNPIENMAKIIYRLSNMAINSTQCAVRDCSNTDIEVHHIRKLYRRTKDGDGNYTIIVKGRARLLTGQLAIESALKRKQIPLCKRHHID